VYVAQPPLFRVKSKKDTWYVQTNEEMRQQLLDRGLEDSQLQLDRGKKIGGEKMARLASILATMEEAILALERRGISLKAHAQRPRDEQGRLPVHHVFFAGQEYWFHSAAERDAFLEREEAAAGKELAVAETPRVPAEEGNGQPNGKHTQVHMTELHEVRTINSGLASLRTEFSFDIDMLIPQERTGSEEPRYVLKKGEHEVPLEDLRSLAHAIRELGQKGLTVTRFKGLGEMNAEELRETTLDPANRTLIKVTMQETAAADDMFRVLMGEKVEPRREFIEKHALEVRNLDV
jgi:DNA gyrase subunit B